MKSVISAAVLSLMFLSFAVDPLLGQQQSGFVPAKLSPESISQLVSPIALYPDALIALILPASTVPSDVVLGARYLSTGGDPAQVDGQTWDESVKSLIRYPDVLSWMDQNLQWTTSLGEAFATQPDDVMNAIQALRAQAQTEGNLTDTPQQKVVVEQDYIRIIPADPEVIYVPQYDPGIVYTQPCQPSYSLISFGIGCAVGAWLSYDFDWHNRCVYHGNWQGWNNGWNGNNGGGTVNVVNISNNTAAVWHPSAQSVQQIAQRQASNGGNARIVRAQGNTVVAPQNATHPYAFNPARNSLIPHPTHLTIARNPVAPAGGHSANPTTSSQYPPHTASTGAPNVTNHQIPSAPPHVPGEFSHPKSLPGAPESFVPYAPTAVNEPPIAKKTVHAVPSTGYEQHAPQQAPAPTEAPVHQINEPIPLQHPATIQEKPVRERAPVQHEEVPRKEVPHAAPQQVEHQAQVFHQVQEAPKHEQPAHEPSAPPHAKSATANASATPDKKQK